MELVTIPCGCVFDKRSARYPVRPCPEHEHVTCGGCGGQATVSPIGVLCLHCTFGRQ